MVKATLECLPDFELLLRSTELVLTIGSQPADRLISSWILGLRGCCWVG